MSSVAYEGFLLTIKNGILAANAGIDLKNAPPGTAILWPQMQMHLQPESEKDA